MKLVINPAFRSLIPPLAPEELAQLESNILAEGCRDPLVAWNGTIVDGHNRYDICTKHGQRFEVLEKEFPDEGTAQEWIVGNQLGRRNLKPDQMSYFRGWKYNRTKGKQGGDHKSKCRSDTLINAADSIAKETGVSRRTIIRDGKRAEVLDKLAETKPEEVKAIIDGRKKFNEVRREIKAAEVKKSAALPTAQYRVIYADPPWSYNDKCDAGSVQGGGCERHYPSMTIPQLCAMPIQSICAKDAVLFLWVTSPLLFECEPIIRAWGFKYKTSFVWDKVKHNMGHYNSVRHEFLLICTRGSCTPDTKKLHDSVQSIERTKHSEKPERFREIIDEIYPHGKRVELFARKEAKGWERWGNQA